MWIIIPVEMQDPVQKLLKKQDAQIEMPFSNTQGGW